MLDPEALKRLSGFGGPKLVRGMVELFLKNAPAKAADLVVFAAASMKGSLDDVAKSVDKVKKAGRKQVLLRLEDGKGDLRFVAVPVQ